MNTTAPTDPVGDDDTDEATWIAVTTGIDPNIVAAVLHALDAWTRKAAAA